MTAPLRQLARKGFRWNLIGAVGHASIQWVQMAVLARLLAPEAFGAMAAVQILLYIGSFFTGLGLATNIQRLPDMSLERISNLFGICLWTGALLAGLLFGLADVLAEWFKRPDYGLFIRIASLYFLLLPWGIPYNGLLLRDMQFNRIAQIELAAAIWGLLFGVVLAMMQAGAFALLGAYLTKTALSSLGFWWVARKQYPLKPMPGFIRENREPLRFGLYEAGSQALSAVAYGIDKFIIGRMLGLEALGYYNLAWQLASIPLSKVNPLINRIMLPVYGKIRDDEPALNRWFAQTQEILLTVNMPILAGLALTGSTLIPLVFGWDWTPAAYVLPYLCAATLLVSLANPSANLFWVYGRSDILFFWNIGLALWFAFITTVCLLFFPDIEGAGIAQLVVAATSILPWFQLLLRVAPLHFSPLKRILLQTGIFTAIMSLVVYGLSELFFPYASWPGLGIQILVGVFVYAGLIYVFKRRLWRLVREKVAA